MAARLLQGIWVPIVCAAGLAITATAAFTVGAHATPPEPLTSPKDKVTCPNDEGKKVENCPKNSLIP